MQLKSILSVSLLVLGLVFHSIAFSATIYTFKIITPQGKAIDVDKVSVYMGISSTKSKEDPCDKLSCIGHNLLFIGGSSGLHFTNGSVEYNSDMLEELLGAGAGRMCLRVDVEKDGKIYRTEPTRLSTSRGYYTKADPKVGTLDFTR